ncbi:sensor histidine kinase [Knoellia subterranea]|uniref:histidine kinase n=1 Tax=Knoellia subterranea KCTC 19937 TaxID=1385521 RepID=A0A0A0JIG0_9MICO|nr:histidine kinase [Knoellia subterranea KCTC 19937]
MSVRLKLTLSYAAFLIVAGAILLAVVWLWLLRYVPDVIIARGPGTPNRGDLQRAFVPKAAWAMFFIVVFGLVGGWLLSGWMLAPLNRITRTTRLVADGSLSQRIRLEGPRDEFRELSDAFDTMLDRLEAHVEEQKRFAANASHELRTPLAITQTLLDVARNDPARESDDLLDRLHAVNVRAIDLTEALLLLSRADRRAFTREPVDLSLLAEDAAETFLPLAESRGVTLEVDGDAAPTDGSPALLLQLVTNLVHNAVVHNLAEEGRVWVSTAAGQRRCELVVENTGPVVSGSQLATLVEPFQRGAGRTRTDHGGVGLGLAIAKAITEAHDGTLALAPREGGGLRITARLARTSREATAGSVVE